MAKKDNNELANRNQAFLIYQDDNGIARVNVRFEGEDVWLTQEQMMELFDASQQDVSYHIGQIYEEEEQDPERTHKKFLLVRQEGNRSVRRQISHYNLDMIITVGYRVKSQVDNYWWGKVLSVMRRQSRRPSLSLRNTVRWRCYSTRVTTIEPLGS